MSSDARIIENYVTLKEALVPLVADGLILDKLFATRVLLTSQLLKITSAKRNTSAFEATDLLLETLLQKGCALIDRFFVLLGEVDQELLHGLNGLDTPGGSMQETFEAGELKPLDVRLEYLSLKTCTSSCHFVFMSMYCVRIKRP